MTSTPPPRSGVPDGLMDAFWAYERALMTDDLEALDRLFAPGPATLRGDAAGLLVGHDAISEFRGARGGAPARRIVETHVQVVDDDHALVVAVTELARGGRGQQTQLWTRIDSGWAVSAAHVAVPPPALDTRIWRVVGDPLVPATAAGALAGTSVAVKDLYAVAGQRIGAGNPAWLADAPVQPEHAVVVAQLLAAGADVRGIARTDEFAWSLAGTNAHHGAPPNPRAPYRIPGGSSSGSASAVSLGHASIGLGTDTGGSIRVPAAYQGLYGLRTTHDLVSREGLLPLAPSFDTVGWLTRDADLLGRVGEVLLPASSDASGGSDELVVVPELLALATPEVADAVAAAVPEARRESWELPLAEWHDAFGTLQAWEAWQQHGAWVEGRLDTLGPDVAGRFRTASTVTREAADRAQAVVTAARDRIRDLVGDRVLVLPSASSVAPRLGAPLDDVRTATLRLTLLAGLGGLPALSVPTETADRLPCGVCFVAAPGRDRDLLDLAVRRETKPLEP
ncbi:AtzH-like domain-containing protein [Nocardioides campestrisoli]|uniref:AtzH-like domain-containing protein n=1 Tax=Nocardioides campestrisoli TaxID=2736757 RepID=UPI0028115861|nr:AtzH-like domain-containing protein [Nocardioides campestrisoli]